MAWKKKDVDARNFLFATIDNAQQRALVNCKTSLDMWTRLSAQHLQNAADNIHVLQQKFFEYQFQPDNTVIAHITEIETMARHLADIDAEFTEVQVMAKIICTLPPSFRNFASVWDNVHPADRTIKALTSRLLKEESMAKRWTGIGKSNTADVAFWTHNFPPSPLPTSVVSSVDAPSNSLSHGGASRGRFRRTRRGGGSGLGSERVTDSTGKMCSHCGRNNHDEKNCFDLLRDKRNAERIALAKKESCEDFEVNFALACSSKAEGQNYSF